MINTDNLKGFCNFVKGMNYEEERSAKIRGQQGRERKEELYSYRQRSHQDYKKS